MLDLSKKGSSERWQPEWVSTILDPENAHQETVHAEENSCPNNHRRLLSLGVLDPWNSQREIDRRKGKKSIFVSISNVWTFLFMRNQNLHMAATT